MNDTRTELKKLLNREVGVEKLKTGKFMAKYLAYGTSPSPLVADSEEEALEKLLTYLKTKPKQE